MGKIGKIGEGWGRAEGRRVGPLEVGRPIPAAAATAASAGGMQELVPFWNCMQNSLPVFRIHVKFGKKI